MADNEIKIKFTAEDEMQGKLDNIKAGFTALGVGIAVVAVAWKMATQEMKALSKAIEKNPDMFTKEQKDNVDQYNHSLKEVSTNFDQIKAIRSPQQWQRLCGVWRTAENLPVYKPSKCRN